MRLAMIGTRGVPAHYGGFETAIEEIGRRLADRGHDVVVYCRGAADRAQTTHLGMELVHLPAARKRSLETLSHTALSTVDLTGRRGRFDAAVVFNAANAPFVPIIRARGIPVAIHVDGLEWQRTKWSGAGQAYYRAVESLSVRWGDALIADAQGIADYYEDEFGAKTELIAYGAPVQHDPSASRIAELGLTRREYHLVVARFEPENHVAEIVTGYRASASSRPLVVVGSAPYSTDYTRRITALAADDSRVRLLGGVWDDEQLDQLYAHALTYLHGHSVGGTNPSLLRAMGAATAVVAFDVVFNREVLGDRGAFFSDAASLASAVDVADADPAACVRRGASLRERAATVYRWDDVTDKYEDLLRRLAGGESVRGVNRARWRRAGPGRPGPRVREVAGR